MGALLGAMGTGTASGVGGFLAANPLGTFALLLALSVLVPPLFRRLGLADLVGLLVVGPHGLGWVTPESETVTLLSDVGVVYLLFLAGLEIDLAEFQRIRQRSFRFGLLTFGLPMAADTALGFASGFPPVSAVLLGSILASHTPLGYPIVRSLIGGEEGRPGLVLPLAVVTPLRWDAEGAAAWPSPPIWPGPASSCSTPRRSAGSWPSPAAHCCGWTRRWPAASPGQPWSRGPTC
ncbi:MAG: cation:proton antiporter [Synechococcus sp.]